MPSCILPTSQKKILTFHWECISGFEKHSWNINNIKVMVCESELDFPYLQFYGEMKSLPAPLDFFTAPTPIRIWLEISELLSLCLKF
jgi:hypothetical protein